MNKIMVSAKGQVVIPAKIRRRHKIRKGTRLYLEERGDELVLTVLSPDYIKGLAGILPTKGKLSKALLQERARDKAKGS